MNILLFYFCIAVIKIHNQQLERRKVYLAHGFREFQLIPGRLGSQGMVVRVCGSYTHAGKPEADSSVSQGG